eukprot:TRINITY_DN4339_c0_g1_i1.p1 TRINITY_DN4339_c0_g1~~TRINITY_DN4339_c0_g1_i1.p1  ORF type:complete len:191 (-),score=30.64 TRINITY_DN4339_c0_g1_i1:29-601(-)
MRHLHGVTGCVGGVSQIVVRLLLLFYSLCVFVFFFFNDTATTEIYTLHIVGSVRCVQETGINAEYMGDIYFFYYIQWLINRKKNKTFVCNCKEDQVELKHYCQKDQQLFCSDSLLDHADHKQVIQRVGQTQIDEMIQQTLSILKKDIEERQKRLQQLSLIHISEPTRLGMISYAVFCLKKKKKNYKLCYQ